MREGLRLAVIGGGKMGEALVAGLVAGGALTPDRISVAEPDAARREALSRRLGVAAHPTAAEALPGADVVLLAVKPQIIDAVVGQLARDLPKTAGGEEPLVISIAAGVSTARLEALFDRPVPVVRVMPNQAAVVAKAVSAISGGMNATTQHVELAREIMSAVGAAVMVPEGLMNAATALSGSGPAYVDLFAEGLIQAGIRQGLSRAQASELVIETIRGAGEMLATGGHPAELIDAVASPGGTTIAALEAFEMSGFRAALFSAVEAAVDRAEELG